MNLVTSSGGGHDGIVEVASSQAGREAMPDFNNKRNLTMLILRIKRNFCFCSCLYFTGWFFVFSNRGRGRPVGQQILNFPKPQSPSHNSNNIKYTLSPRSF